MFQKICVIGAEAFEAECREAISKLSLHPVQWIEPREIPKGHVFAGVDALLVSLRIAVGPHELDCFPELRYLGIYGTNLVPIDLAQCAKRQVSVRNIHDYCDEDTAQWCILQMLMCARGNGPLRWRETIESLTGVRLGVLGLGAVGLHVAKLGVALGMEVRYCARTQKPEAEALGIRRGDLGDVIEFADFVSVHTPALQQLVTLEHTERLGRGAVVVNTCVGQPIEPDGLAKWLDQRDGRLILDSMGGVYYPQFSGHPRVHITRELAHMTARSELRRRNVLIDNMTTYLATHVGSCFDQEVL